jgi:hypothetical protein
VPASPRVLQLDRITQPVEAPDAPLCAAIGPALYDGLRDDHR